MKSNDKISEMLMNTPFNDLTLLVSITHADGSKHNVKLSEASFFENLFSKDLTKERLDNTTAKKFGVRYVGQLSPKHRMLYRVKGIADTVLGYESTASDWSYKLI